MSQNIRLLKIKSGRHTCKTFISYLSYLLIPYLISGSGTGTGIGGMAGMATSGSFGRSGVGISDGAAMDSAAGAAALAGLAGGGGGGGGCGSSSSSSSELKFSRGCSVSMCFAC